MIQQLQEFQVQFLEVARHLTWLEIVDVAVIAPIHPARRATT